MEQIKIDLQPMTIDQGKKTERLTCSCSEDFLLFVEKMASMRNLTRSELVYEYVVMGLKRDVGSIFLGAQHLDKPIRDLLNPKKG